MDPTEQIAPMWEAFLGQMTAQGATRVEIVQVALGTALAVLGSTSTALWPGGTVPEEEAVLHTHYMLASRELAQQAGEISAM